MNSDRLNISIEESVAVFGCGIEWAVLNSKKVQKKIKAKSSQKKVEIAQSLHRRPAVRDVLHFSALQMVDFVRSEIGR